jgi:hypothetical protein
VLFYKQANEEFQILQLEADRLDELPSLYADHSPIVVRGIQIPPALGTEETFLKRSHIIQRSVSPGLSLKDLLLNPAALATYTMNPLTAEWLAKESGLKIWFDTHLLSSLLPSQWMSWFYSTKTQLWIHHRGLFKTTAVQTLLLPTQGTIVVSLLLQKTIPYLPEGWQGREFSSLTLADTPLLSQIEFVDVIVRKGAMLLIPAHTLVSFRPQSSSKIPWVFCAELHHPISRLAA